MNVEAIMTTGVVTVSPTDTLATLRKQFSEQRFHHLLVEHKGQLAGVVSDRDMLRYSSPFVGTRIERPEDRALLNKTAADIMSNNTVTVDRSTSIDTASLLLLDNAISCLPVVDAGRKIEGILTWKDILKFHVYGVEGEAGGA